MRVKEIIEKLQQCNPNPDLECYGYFNDDRRCIMQFILGDFAWEIKMEKLFEEENNNG